MNKADREAKIRNRYILLNFAKERLLYNPYTLDIRTTHNGFSIYIEDEYMYNITIDSYEGYSEYIDPRLTESYLLNLFKRIEELELQLDRSKEDKVLSRIQNTDFKKDINLPSVLLESITEEGTDNILAAIKGWFK